MTNSNSKPEQNQPKQRFRAVPPRTPRSNLPAQNPVPPKTSESPSPETKPQRSNTGWWIMGSILLVLAVVSQIPARPNVRAEALLDFDPEARRLIYASEGKIVEVIPISDDDIVVVNQPLLIIENKALDEEIESWYLRRLENKMEVETAEQNMLTAQTRLNSTQANIFMVQQRVDQLQTEINALNNGVSPPDIAGYERQIMNIEEQAVSMQTTIERYEKAREAIAEDQIEGLKRQKSAIVSQIGEFQSAKETVKRRLRDDLARGQEQLAQLQNNSQVAMQEYQAAQNAVNSRLPMEDAFDQKISELEDRREQEKVIVSPIAGKVITKDRSLLKGRVLQKGEELLEIADTKRLIAEIEVTQEDRDLVQEGADVKLNPPEFSISPVETKITKIIDVIELDENLKKSMVTVKAEIDNTLGQLQPGAKMYARIESPEKITLGQQAWRQIVNLLKIRSL